MNSPFELIEETARRGMPSPGTAPKRKRNESAAAFEARVLEHQGRTLAHLAVHGADPFNRENCVGYVWDALVAGEPLPEWSRDWLLFVLASLRVNDSVPTLYRSRPRAWLTDLRRLHRLADFILEDKRKRPKATVPQRLDAAEKVLRKSESTLRTIYYSPEFRRLLALKEAKASK